MPDREDHWRDHLARVRREDVPRQNLPLLPDEQLHLAEGLGERPRPVEVVQREARDAVCDPRLLKLLLAFDVATASRFFLYTLWAAVSPSVSLVIAHLVLITVSVAQVLCSSQICS